MSALRSLLKRISAQEKLTLAPFSTLKVGGSARYFVNCASSKDLQLLQIACLEYNTPIHILSGGSNTLFSDHGFDGVVIKLGAQFEYTQVAPDGFSIIVGAATSYAKLTKLALNLGWSCAPGWAGIPGLIGGAIRMNAGTRRGEIADAIIEVYGVLDGQEIGYKTEQIVFSYRGNILPKNLIITGAKLACAKNELAKVADLLIEVKNYQAKRKLSQPATSSAGSFFKNPHGYFAGRLIEECGLKGLMSGGAQVSTMHANFIVNTGQATALDIVNLSEQIQQRVWENSGIKLTPEIRMVGDFKNAMSNL